MVFGKSLNEESIGIAAAIGAERDADARAGELLQVDFVDGERLLEPWDIGELGLFFALSSKPGGLCSAQALQEERILQPGGRLSVDEHGFFPRERPDHRHV